MNISQSTIGRGTLLAVTGRLDLKTATEFRLHGSEALHGAQDALVVDLTEVDFIDSSGLGALIGLHRQATRAGLRLEIIPPTGAAREIFTLTRTDRYFTLIGSLGEAAAA
jgi:anti-sigma B factor antagonist